MTAKHQGMKRTTGILLALGLVASFFVGGSTASGAPCGAKSNKGTKHGLETLTLRMFHIEAKFTKKAYKIGDTVKIPVNLTRPAKEDPLKQGLPWDRPFVEPAADINVGVGLLVGDVFLPGFSVTNGNGKAVIKVKLESYVRPTDEVDLAFYAWHVIQETPCATIQEDGFRVYQGPFKVTK